MSINKVVEPKTLKEAKQYLANYKNTSKILAGGTDLVIEVNRGEIEAEQLISLNKVEELKVIQELEEYIFLGSMVTFTDLKKSSLIQEWFGALLDCSNSMGSPQIRNMATIGGNIVNAASAADIIPVLMVLDAMLVIESIEGSRMASCIEYFKNYKEEKIKAEEILKAVLIPKQKTISGFYKLGKRNALAISRINVAVSFEMDSVDDVAGNAIVDTVKRKVKNFKIALGAVGRYPFRVQSLESQMVGKEIAEITTEKVLSYIENVVVESIKGRPTMPFKKEAIKGVYKEAVKRALERRGDTNE